MGLVNILFILLDRWHTMLISMSMDDCSDFWVDDCCCSFILWGSFDFKLWKSFLYLFLFASWLGWLVCILCCKIFEDDEGALTLKDQWEIDVQTKTHTNHSNQDASKKGYKKYFQGLKSKLRHNLTLQQQPSTSESLQTSIDIEISMAYCLSNKLSMMLTNTLPTAIRQKHTPFPLIKRRCS